MKKLLLCFSMLISLTTYSLFTPTTNSQQGHNQSVQSIKTFPDKSNSIDAINQAIAQNDQERADIKKRIITKTKVIQQIIVSMQLETPAQAEKSKKILQSVTQDLFKDTLQLKNEEILHNILLQRAQQLQRNRAQSSANTSI